MVAISGYKGLNVITPFPEGSGGKLLNLNFKIIGDVLESGNDYNTELLQSVYEDKTPQLGGPLDLTYSSIIYNYLGSGVFLGGLSGIGLIGDDNIDYTSLLNCDSTLTSNHLDSRCNTDLKFATAAVSGKYIAGDRNSFLVGYNNKIAYTYIHTSVIPNGEVVKNSIVGGINNRLYHLADNNALLACSNTDLHNQNIFFSQEFHASRNCYLSTTDCASSGYPEDDYLSGYSPKTRLTNFIPHGIYPIGSGFSDPLNYYEGGQGGFQAVEFFYRGDFSNGNGTVGLFGYRTPYESVLDDKEFAKIGSDKRQGISYLEIYPVISASGNNGIHVAAWAPIHVKSFRFDRYNSYTGKFEPQHYITTGHTNVWGLIPDGDKFISCMFDGSGSIDHTQWALPIYSKYNHGLSGHLVINPPFDIALTGVGFTSTLVPIEEFKIYFECYGAIDFRATVYAEGFETREIASGIASY